MQVAVAAAEASAAAAAAPPEPLPPLPPPLDLATVVPLQRRDPTVFALDRNVTGKDTGTGDHFTVIKRSGDTLTMKPVTKSRPKSWFDATGGLPGAGVDPEALRAPWVAVGRGRG